MLFCGQERHLLGRSGCGVGVAGRGSEVVVVVVVVVGWDCGVGDADLEMIRRRRMGRSVRVGSGGLVCIRLVVLYGEREGREKKGRRRKDERSMMRKGEEEWMSVRVGCCEMCEEGKVP